MCTNKILTLLCVAGSWAGTSCPKMMSSGGETTWCPTTSSTKLYFRWLLQVFSVQKLIKALFSSHACWQLSNVWFLCGCRVMAILSSMAGSLCGLQTLKDQTPSVCACRLTATWSCTTSVTRLSGTQTLPTLPSATCAVFNWPMTANWCWTESAKKSGALKSPKAWSDACVRPSFDINLQRCC